MNSVDRVLLIPHLFTQDHPVWTADEVAGYFRISVSQAYRYCRALVDVGMLDPLLPAGFTLGPAIIELNRNIQLLNPLIAASRPVMISLMEHVPAGTTILVSKLYHSKVMCLEQVTPPTTKEAISFERGRPMPLLWGATSKAILAFMTIRDLRRVYGMEQAPAGLEKPPFDQLRAELKEIRKAGYSVARAEVDPNRIGIAAPIFDKGEKIMGSLTAAIPLSVAPSDSERSLVRRLSHWVVVSAKEIEEGLHAAVDHASTGGLSPTARDEPALN